MLALPGGCPLEGNSWRETRTFHTWTDQSRKCTQPPPPSGSLSPAQGPSALITARPGPREPAAAAAADPTVLIQTSQSEASLPFPASRVPWKPGLKRTHVFFLTPSAPIDPVALCGMPRPRPRASSLLQSFLHSPVFLSLIKTNAGTSWIRYQVMREVTLVTLKPGTEGLPWQSSG